MTAWWLPITVWPPQHCHWVVSVYIHCSKVTTGIGILWCTSTFKQVAVFKFFNNIKKSCFFIHACSYMTNYTLCKTDEEWKGWMIEKWCLFTDMVCVHFNNYCLKVEHVIYNIVIDIIGHSLQTYSHTSLMQMLMLTIS